MPSTRFSVPNFETLMPSTEARVSPATHVLDGRNFTWDSKGPKSGFGAELLSAFQIERPKDIQSIRVQDRTFTFTQDAILTWRTSAPYTWELLYQFDSELPINERLPWQVIYLDGDIIVTHPSRGLFMAPYVTGQNKFTFTPKTSLDIPGLPGRIKGMLVVRGRPVLVTDDTAYWGGVGALTDLTPALAGAGFQRIDGIVAGSYLALTSWQNGFIVWTTKGAMIAEFIDGDTVWRFDPLISQEKPLSGWCTLELSTGMSAMLTNHGLFYSPDSPQPWVPQFNEFFREYVKDMPVRSYFFRLDYDINDESVYISESHNGVTFQRAFVLKPTLDKWGLFNVESHGFGEWTAEDFGYVTLDGSVFRFTDVFFVQNEPDIADGQNRYYPLLQKSMNVPSSTLVTRSLVYDPAEATQDRRVVYPAWYMPGQFQPASPNRGPMDSWIKVGYLRSPELNMAADAYAEFQEIVIFGIKTQPDFAEDFTTEWNSSFFYPESEDLNYDGTITAVDIIDDLMTGSGIDDWNEADPSRNVDWLYESSYVTVVDPDVPIEDWNLGSESEDWSHSSADFPKVSYDVTIHASQDGHTTDDYIPELAKFQTASQTYSTFTSGTLTHLGIWALNVNQWYHVTGLELTMGYGGQQQ